MSTTDTTTTAPLLAQLAADYRDLRECLDILAGGAPDCDLALPEARDEAWVELRNETLAELEIIEHAAEWAARYAGRCYALIDELFPDPDQEEGDAEGPGA